MPSRFSRGLAWVGVAFLVISVLPTGLIGSNEAYIHAPKELAGLFDDPNRVGTRLSPFDELIRKHARNHDLDWRLVASIIYAESRFDHAAVSHAGARGLMQLMPVVLRATGLESADHPGQNILAGIRHFLWGRGKLRGVTEQDRLSLALAAYNAGLGHVRDAQILARKLGRNPRKWEDVGAMFLLLELPSYYKAARYGYVNGSQSVHYVSTVKKKYEAYLAEFPDPKSLPFLAGTRSGRPDV